MFARRLPIVLAAAFGVVASVATADDDRQRHRECLQAVAHDAESGFEDALTWRDLGGGAAARHCVAVALVALGRHAEAGERFLDLAGVETRPTTRARLFAQAAHAWMLGQDATRAEAVLDAALALNPDDAELWIDRAAARAALGRYQRAIDDLDQAIARNARSPDAFAFRASAHRLAGDVARALADAEAALRLAPAHPEALLERGMARRLTGDHDAARRDWIAVITQHPDSDAADIARTNIERLDLEPE